MSNPIPPSAHPPPSDSLSTLDPTATLLNSSCLDFLLIELVPMAYRLTAELAAREEEWISNRGTYGHHTAQGGMGGPGKKEKDGETEGSVKGTGAGGSRAEDARSTSGVSGLGLTGTAGTGTAALDEEEAREAVFRRLEQLGYRVGLGVVERFSRDKPRPSAPLDIIKFLCKDLWTLLFKKQIDNLKTNHRGIYVLTDNAFAPLKRASFDLRRPPSSSGGGGGGAGAGSAPSAAGGAAGSTTGVGALGLGAGAGASTGAGAEGSVKEGSMPGRDPGGIGMGTGISHVQPFLYFPAGVLRGSLAALGIQATVQAETSAPPTATFQIRTVGAKA